MCERVLACVYRKVKFTVVRCVKYLQNIFLWDHLRLLAATDVCTPFFKVIRRKNAETFYNSSNKSEKLENKTAKYDNPDLKSRFNIITKT